MPTLDSWNPARVHASVPENDGITRRVSSWALLVCVVSLGIALGDYFLRDVKDVDSTGQKLSTVREFGEGTLIAQSFSMPRDGLRALTVSLWSDEPAAITFEFHLFRRGQGPSEEVVTRVVEVSKPAGTVRQTIEFPAISPAKHREFVARFQLTRALARNVEPTAAPAARPSVGLIAWGDNPLPSGMLWVGDEERWGDLDFSAEADPPTRLQRMAGAIDASLQPALRLTTAGALLLAILYGVMVVAVAASAAASTGQKTPRFGDQSAFPALHTRGTERWARRVAAVALGVGTPALFLTILATRERPAVDLMNELDLAVMESPAGMHGAFSLWQEAINGNAPQALFAHPPSRIIWTVAVPARKPLLKTSVALRPYVWENRSDGVTFAISVDDGGHVTDLSSRFVNPGDNLNDRAWLAMDVDLSPYAGRSVRIVLTTSPGPAGNVGWDWAMWGDPRIVER